jgi:hypothetical protein
VSNPYRANPEQWAAMEYEATMELASRACILELRARVEELEDDAMEQSRSQEFCLDYIIKRLEKLEAASSHTSQEDYDRG